MNEFKYQFVNVLLLALLGFGIYWAFTTIDNGIIYDKDLIEDPAPEQQVKEPETPIFSNTKPQGDLNTEPVQSNPSVVDAQEPKERVLSENEQYLVTKLEGLIKDKIQMKKKSRGTRVGTVQKFLNLYFGKEEVVDNQYGPGTIERVKQFQQKRDQQ